MKEISTKEKLIIVGENLFSKKGYEGTSVSDICKEAGFSKGAFFYYFPTKEDFFLEILDRWLLQLSQRLENYRLNSPKILDGILRMTEIFEDVFRESKERLYLFLEFLRIGIRDEKIIKKIGLQFKKFKDYFSFVIEEGIKEGSFKNIDSHMIAKLLISFSLGTIFQEIFDSSENWEKFSLEGIKFIISTIKKEEK